MGGEILVLGIIAMGTWLIPFFGLPIPIIGLVWGIMILRRRPVKKAMTISGVVLSSIGLFLAVSYTIISVIGSTPDIFNTSPGGGSDLPPAGPVDWKADGKIEPSEYENSQFYSSGFTVYWKNDTQFVYIGLQSSTEGWLSLSFIDNLRSGGMDTIIGFADTAGQSSIFDLWSPTHIEGSAKNDTELGGQFSLIDWAVLQALPVDEEEVEAYTVVEFRRRLNTGDANDIQLLPGPNLFIWAYSNSDDIKTSSAFRGYGVIELK